MKDISIEINNIYDFVLSTHCIIGIAATNNISNNTDYTDNAYEVDVLKDLAICTTDCFSTARIKTLLIPVHNTVLFFLKTNDAKSRALFDIFNDAQNRMKSFNTKIKLSVGISNPYIDMHGSRESLKQAVQACITAQSNKDPICFYNKIGMNKLLLAAMENKQLLEQYHNDILGPLVQYDILSGADLTNTLEAYIESNCSINEASSNLYIHRNTLKYRLSKIEEILNCNLNSVDVITSIVTCIKIEKLKTSWQRFSEFL